jgi:hypothetical protein
MRRTRAIDKAAQTAGKTKEAASSIAGCSFC